MENNHYQPKHTAQHSSSAPRRRPTSDPSGENRRPRRKAKSNKGCGFALLYFIIIFGLSICCATVAIFAANDVLALVKTDRDITVVLSEDTTLAAMSDQLDESGIVNYGFLFKTYIELSDKDMIVTAGSYTLNPTMDYSQIVAAMTSNEGKPTIRVTIPEGYTIEQIRTLLLENNVTNEQLLDESLSEYPFKHEFLKSQQPPEENWLEGYLFPDTYEFIQGTNDPVHDVINRMLNNFDNKYDEEIQAGADALGLTTDEVVIIASLIEREAQVDEDFARISGVIHNRLNNPSEFPYLQIDASLQYAIGHKSALTEEDLQYDSPYNLYLYEGLPPGPICNPGYEALYAATHPEEHDYYYYVAMPDGSHLFAETNSEHNENRARAERAFAEAAEENNNE